MTAAQELGRFAEDTVAEYLLSMGWKVIARNVRNDYDELDIVAFDTTAKPEELVIVEVRCRTVNKIQSPLESIGFRKLRTLLRASQKLTEKMNWSGFWRIDAVGITINDKNSRESWKLEHIKDITAGRTFLH